MANPICLIKTIWRSLVHMTYVSGCDSETVYDTPPNVHVIKCKRCGKESTTWSWNSLEEQK